MKEKPAAMEQNFHRLSGLASNGEAATTGSAVPAGYRVAFHRSTMPNSIAPVIAGLPGRASGRQRPKDRQGRLFTPMAGRIRLAL